MNFIKSKWGKLFCEIIFFVLLFFFTLVMYIFLKPQYSTIRNGVVAQTICGCCSVIIIFVGVVLYIKKKLTFNTFVFLCLLIAYFIRLGYMLTTPYNTRQYDTVTNNNDGHEAYAWILYTTGKLPNVTDSNGFLKYQFYHPPLNAAVQAAYMHLSAHFLSFYNFINNTSYYDINEMHTLFQTTQVLALLYTMLISYFGIKTIYLIKKPIFHIQEGNQLDKDYNLTFKDNLAVIFGVVFAIFFPRLFQLSAQENNDAICAMFSIAALYFSLKWWKDSSWKNIIPIAFCIGLAMMAKLAAASVALSTAFVFIFVFIKTILSKDKKAIFNISAQFVVFLIICCPLGLWFQIYAGINYHQPLGFVFSNLNQKLSVAEYNFFQRFINLFEFSDYTINIYARAFDNYNLFGYLIKTSIFGEFSYWQGEVFAVISEVFNYLFVLSSFYLYVVYLFKSKGENFKEKIFGIVILISQAVMMLYFNISMPYGCTMDFRYIIPIILGFAIMSTLTIDKLSKENNYIGFISKLNFSFGIIFIISSSLFYMVCI